MVSKQKQKPKQKLKELERRLPAGLLPLLKQQEPSHRTRIQPSVPVIWALYPETITGSLVFLVLILSIRFSSLPKGQISSVLKSNVGFHIIQVTDRIDQRFLSLEDPIFPGQNVSVREFIKQQLSSVVGQAVLKEAIDKTTAALRADATILNFFDTMYPAN
jgi:hypothetical protein